GPRPALPSRPAYHEPRPVAPLAILDAQVAAQGAGGGARHRQPQPGAGDAVHLAGAPVGLEDRLAFLRRHARPLVAHPNDEVRALSPQLDLDIADAARVLDGVLHEVREDGVE